QGSAIHLRGDVILIATGSHPYRPHNLPFHDLRIFDSDTILNLAAIPPTMLVAGGGVIGCEYACMFAALGIKVVLVEGRERLLGFMDGEISQCLADCMKRMGIELHMPDSLESVDVNTSLRVR